MNTRGEWKCCRCGSDVDMIAFKCNCTESPSPWELKHLLKKKYKEYEVSLWPNNQPPILLGYYIGKNKLEAKREACKDNGISEKDKSLQIVLNGRSTPIKRWKKL